VEAVTPSRIKRSVLADGFLEVLETLKSNFGYSTILGLSLSLFLLLVKRVLNFSLRMDSGVAAPPALSQVLDGQGAVASAAEPPPPSPKSWYSMKLQRFDSATTLESILSVILLRNVSFLQQPGAYHSILGL
jgi:hypothetical protein